MSEKPKKCILIIVHVAAWLFLTGGVFDNICFGQPVTKSGHNNFELFVREGVLLNVIVNQRKAPFYSQDKSVPNISFVSAEAERIYTDNLLLSKELLELKKVDQDTWTCQETEFSNKNTVQRLQISDDLAKGHLTQQVNKQNFQWNLKLKNDNLHDYFFVGRQWLKKYQEPILTPLFFGTQIIFRNEWRIFSVDKISGKQLWSWSLPESLGYEYYQTLRHPHINSYGNEISIYKNKLITELDGHLLTLSLDANAAKMPKIIWQHNLGEYRLCTKPLVTDSQVIVGIINSREAISICAFDLDSGDMKWDRYIGVAAFLGPVCELGLYDKKHAIVATNYGVLVKLDRVSGQVSWIKKYTPKKYNIFDYWQMTKPDSIATEKYPIEFDSSFLELDKGSRIYYKPRESHYLYVIDYINGKNLKKVRIKDQEIILRATREKIIILKTDGPELDDDEMELAVYDLNTNDLIDKHKFKKGKIKGIFYPSEHELVFKIDDKLHFFNIKEMYYYKRHTPLSGWLLNLRENIIVAKNGSNLEASSIIYKLSGVSSQKNSPLELDNTDQVNETRFNKVSFCKKQINIPPVPQRKTILKESVPLPVDLLVEGDRMDIVPVKPKQHVGALDFFLLKWFDQVLCVDRYGNIKWIRNFFFANKALLYDQTLVIIDALNIVAVNKNSGNYLWSLTVRDDYKDKDKVHAMLQVKDADEKIIAYADQGIYIIDPVKGDLIRRTSVPKGTYTLEVDGQFFCLMDKKNKKLISGNVYLESLIKSHMEKGQFKKGLNNVFMTGEYLVLNAGKKIFSIGLKTGKRLDSKDLSDKEDFFIEKYNDSFLVFYPGKGVVSFRVNKGKINFIWDYFIDADILSDESTDPERPIWNAREKSYLIKEGKIMLAIKQNDRYSLIVLDAEKGNFLSKISLSNLEGVFAGIFMPAIINNKCYFSIMLRCEYEGEDKAMKLNTCGASWLAQLAIYFCKFDLVSGKLNYLLRGPLTSMDLPSQIPTSTETLDSLIRVVNGQYLYMEANQQ